MTLLILFVISFLAYMPVLNAQDAQRENIANLRAIYNQGIEYFEAGDYDNAIDSFQAVVEARPDMAAVHNLIGVAYVRKKSDPSNAIEAFEKALKYDPNNAESYFNLASIYMGPSRDPYLAQEYYEKAIELKPDYSLAYFGLGWIELLENDDAVKAAQMFQKTIEGLPDFAEGYLGLGMAYLRLNKKEMVLHPISKLRSLDREELALRLEGAMKKGEGGEILGPGLNPIESNTENPSSATSPETGGVPPLPSPGPNDNFYSPQTNSQ